MKSVMVEGQRETFETSIKLLDVAKAAYRAALKDRQDCQAALRGIEARQRQLDDAIQDARLKLASRSLNPLDLDLERLKAHGRELAAMQGEISAWRRRRRPCRRNIPGCKVNFAVLSLRLPTRKPGFGR